MDGHRFADRIDVGRDLELSPPQCAEAGIDGAEIGRHLRRLLSLRTKAEYEPDKIPLSATAKAVERAPTCVAIANRVVTSLT